MCFFVLLKHILFVGQKQAAYEKYLKMYLQSFYYDEKYGFCSIDYSL